MRLDKITRAQALHRAHVSRRVAAALRRHLLRLCGCLGAPELPLSPRRPGSLPDGNLGLLLLLLLTLRGKL